MMADIFAEIKWRGAQEMRNPGNENCLQAVRQVYFTELGVNKTGPYLGVVNASGDEGKPV